VYKVEDTVLKKTIAVKIINAKNTPYRYLKREEVFLNDI